MQLNTKQVRAIGNVIAGCAAKWTEKTSDYNLARRSIVWDFYDFEDANTAANKMREALAKQGATNKVTVTGAWGGVYMRVIADLAE